MKTKNMTVASILLALGTVMHFIIPGVFGMKPDFLLMMMFIAILYNRKLSSVIAISIAAGILAAITTTFPGGQIPSIFDKLGSGIFVYMLINLYLKKYKLSSIFIFVMGFIGTMVSGCIFIYLAYTLVGLPGGISMKELLIMVVLPTSLITGIINTILLKVILSKQKYSYK